MTNEQQKAKEYAELLTAFAEGKQLQFLNDDGYWCDYQATIKDIVEEFLYLDNVHIRIKPETKREPLNQQDLIEMINEGKTMWVRSIGGSTYQKIIMFGKEYLTVSGATLYYGVLVDNYEFLDGTPCYKEVECE